MNASPETKRIRRVLIVDDNRAIHDDFQNVLMQRRADDLAQFEAELFGAEPAAEVPTGDDYEFQCALQGEEAIELVRVADQTDNPFDFAFVDMRMPPGLNGLETIKALWQIAPDLEVVLCTAYSDYSWQEIIQELGSTDQLLILKKPFESVEVRQIAMSLGCKCDLKREQRQKVLALETAVQQRTEELSEALAAAQSANRSKTEFLANVSHEIRTPMTAILGFTDILLDEIDGDSSNPRMTETVDVIRRNGEHLLELINDILDLCKVEAGMLSVEPRPFRPVDVIEDVATLMQVKSDAKQLELSCEYDDSLPDKVFSDPKRLKQILVNLVGNAIKFTETGSVHVQARRCGDDPRLIEIDVIDTGIGISVEQRSKLFLPFTQADTSVTRRYGGTGLGLSISRRLAKLLGGDIRIVDSRPGQGSRFRVYIACGELPESEQDPRDVIESSNKPGVPSAIRAIAEAARLRAAEEPLLGFCILLAEDGPDNQVLVQRLLRKAGAEVVLAENGQFALDKARLAMVRGEPYSVILMDMQMPIMDGYEATRILRSEGYEWPIVALTAHNMPGDRERCLEAGCDEYASKPIQKKELLNLLTRFSPQSAVCDRGHGVPVESA